jgi:ketosteroid isomerase-like protein
MADVPGFADFRAARDRFLSKTGPGACGRRPDHEGGMVSRTDVELLREGYEAFARGDIPAVLEVFDPAIDWTEPEGNPWPARYRGHEEVVGLWRTAGERLGPEWQVVPERFLATEGGVMVLGEHRGRNTDGRWRVPFAMLFEMRGGKAVRFVQYCDTHLMRKAAGA